MKEQLVKELDWFSQEIPTTIGTVRDLDILARVIHFQRGERPSLAADQKDNAEYYTIVIADSKGNYFNLDFRSYNARFFGVGDVVKVRSVTLYSMLLSFSLINGINGHGSIGRF